MRLFLPLLIIFLSMVCFLASAVQENNTITMEDLINENDQVLKINPENQSALLYRVLIYYNGEKYPDAISSAEAVIKKYPNSSLAWHMIGSSWVNLKDYTKAAEAFGKAAAITPDDPAEYNLQGVSLSRLGKNDEAVAVLQKATQLNPGYAVAWNNLGVTYRNMNETNLASDTLNTAISKDNNNAVFFSNKGFILLDKHDYSGAINCAKEAKRIDMTNVPQWFVAGDAYYIEQNYLDAFYSYDGGFTTMEKNNLWFYQGIKNSRITKQMEPVEAYYSSVSSNVRFTGEWDQVRVIEYKLKRYQNTLDVYDQVIAITPDLTEAWRRKGYCALKIENYESAGDAYGRALESKPGDPDLLASYGFAKGKLGDYLVGMESINQALKIDNTLARAYIFKGELFTMYGQRKEAIDALNQALIYDPHNVDAFFSLSSICLKNGDYPGAAINFFRGTVGY